MPLHRPTRNLSYKEHCALTVDWYMAHGSYPQERIRLDSAGIKYVIGDVSWHQRYPSCHEYIDSRMNKELGL